MKSDEGKIYFYNYCSIDNNTNSFISMVSCKKVAPETITTAIAIAQTTVVTTVETMSTTSIETAAVTISATETETAPPRSNSKLYIQIPNMVLVLSCIKLEKL